MVAECGLTLRKAIDNKANYIDTAPWYGQGERRFIVCHIFPDFRDFLKSEFFSKMENLITIEKLGKKVGKLGLGGSPFGSCYGNDIEIEECGKVIDISIKSKVNYIDTAPWYGQGTI